jgi:hypothetical protein
MFVTVSYCDTTVAIAAPPTPSLRENIKMGSKATLTRLPATAKIMNNSISAVENLD